jgi:TolC family type I secretion outer membrane protein
MNRAWYEGVLPRWAALLALLYVVLSPVLAQPQEFPVDFEVEPPPRESLTLEQALAAAVRNHPLLQQSLAQVEAQEFAVTASTAPRYPKFSFNTTASQSGSENQPGGQEVVRTGLQRSYGYGISLSQQIFDFGRTHHSIRLSELELGSTRLSYLQTRQSVLNSVVQAYFNLLQQDQAIMVDQENVRNAQEVLRQAQGFLEAGTGAKIAVIQAEADLANAQFGLVRSKGAYGRARAALAQAMGLDSLEGLQAEQTTLEVPEWSPETVRQYARTARPDVAAASIDVAQAETRVRLAKSQYYPTISANAGYNWSDQVFPPNNTFYNVGVSLSVPLINEPELSSAVGQAKANVKVALASFRNTEIVAVQEALSAYYTLQESLGQAESAAEALRFATENYRLASERYQVGVGSPLEVSQAQQQLVEARTLEVRARFGVQNSVSALLFATGQIDAYSLLPEDLVIDPIFEIPEKITPES